jgi:hypothetical protein
MWPRTLMEGGGMAVVLLLLVIWWPRVAAALFARRRKQAPAPAATAAVGVGGPADKPERRPRAPSSLRRTVPRAESAEGPGPPLPPPAPLPLPPPPPLLSLSALLVPAATASRASAGPATTVDALPPELLVRILRWLEAADLAVCAQVHPRWRACVLDGGVWRQARYTVRPATVAAWRAFLQREQRRLVSLTLADISTSSAALPMDPVRARSHASLCWPGACA